MQDVVLPSWLPAVSGTLGIVLAWYGVKLWRHRETPSGEQHGAAGYFLVALAIICLMLALDLADTLPHRHFALHFGSVIMPAVMVVVWQLMWTWRIRNPSLPQAVTAVTGAPLWMALGVLDGMVRHRTRTGRLYDPEDPWVVLGALVVSVAAYAWVLARNRRLPDSDSADASHETVNVFSDMRSLRDAFETLPEDVQERIAVTIQPFNELSDLFWTSRGLWGIAVGYKVVSRDEFAEKLAAARQAIDSSAMLSEIPIHEVKEALDELETKVGKAFPRWTRRTIVRFLPLRFLSLRPARLVMQAYLPASLKTKGVWSDNKHSSSSAHGPSCLLVILLFLALPVIVVVHRHATGRSLHYELRVLLFALIVTVISCVVVIVVEPLLSSGRRAPHSVAQSLLKQFGVETRWVKCRPPVIVRRGLEVLAVKPDSEAAATGLRLGDIVIEVFGRPVGSRMRKGIGPPPTRTIAVMRSGVRFELEWRIDK